MRVCKANAHLQNICLVCTVVFVTKQLQRGHVLLGAEFTLRSERELIHCLAGERPEHTNSSFRTQKSGSFF